MKQSKLLSLALSLILALALLAGCSVPQSVSINLGGDDGEEEDWESEEDDEDEDDEEEEEDEDEDDGDGDGETTGESGDGSDAVQDPFYRKVNDMQYVLLSMAYGLTDDPELEKQGTYQAGKDEYWSMLMYLASYNAFSGPFMNRQTVEESYIFIPEDVAFECASAFDPAFNGTIPPVSEDSSRSGSIFYDEGSGEYSFGRGDMGEEVPTLFGFLDKGDGTFTVYSGIMDMSLAAEETDSRKYIDQYSKIRLVKNPYAEKIDDPAYYYSVEAAKVIDREEFEEAEGKLEVFDGYEGTTGRLSSNDSGSNTGSNTGSYGNDREEEDPFRGLMAEEEDSGSGDYILPGSDVEYKSKDEIRGLSDEELRLARNELYARHGRKFKDKKLQDYFNAKTWYEGTRDEVPDQELNQYEIANRDLIVEEEKKRK